MALTGRVADYPQLRGTPFQIAINNHIMQQAESTYGMILLEDNLKTVW
jgi:hypothetical protein